MAFGSGVASSQGVTFKKAAGSAIVFLNSIDGLEVKANTLDTTALDNVGAYKSFISGFKEVSDVSLSGYYSPKDHDGFITDFTAGTAIAYEINFPVMGGGVSGSKWAFNGIVTGFKHKSSVDNVISVDITIKVTGAPTFTPAA